MNNLAFACIAPHGGITLPMLAGPQAQKANGTRLALEELGRRMAATAPETIVLITPHGHRVDGVFSLLNNRRVQGTLEADEGGNANSLTLSFQVDQELNAAICVQARALNVPVARIGYAVPDEEAFVQELDWGALVPLWFMGAQFSPQPRVVIACPDRGNLRDLPWELFPLFGQAVHQAARATGRRIALIASSDLGHAHDPAGPYGHASHSTAAQHQLWREALARRTSPNGVFGLKGFPVQFEALHATNPPLLGEIMQTLLPSRERGRVVLLHRRDRTAHAISYARAILSGIWRAEQEREGRAEPDYSRVAVERSKKLIESQEAAWRAMLIDLSVTPLELWYEDVLADPSAAINAVAGYLDVEIDPEAAVNVPPIERQAQQGARAWARRHAGG